MKTNQNKETSPQKKTGEAKTTIRLNKYIASSGVCSRREADTHIAAGKVTVNGTVIKEMGYQVNLDDVVLFNSKPLQIEELVYVLLNKPKDFITTLDDPQGRRTVFDLIKKATKERIYPVGRLDRMTTGILLFTNDGDLAQKLTHPSHNISKIYQVSLDKTLTKDAIDKLETGFELEDGFIKVDELAVITPDKKTIGVELHSGKNRIVRRMFEALGYEVEKLDRTLFAGLDKKDLPRGKWRFLSKSEISILKQLSS